MNQYLFLSQIYAKKACIYKGFESTTNLHQLIKQIRIYSIRICYKMFKLQNLLVTKYLIYNMLGYWYEIRLQNKCCKSLVTKCQSYDTC